MISPTEIPVKPLINKRTIQVAEIGPEVLDKDEGILEVMLPETKNTEVFLPKLYMLNSNTVHL